MAVPRRYPPELIDAAVQRVADTRAIKAYGAVTTVARQLNLDPRLVQKWVSKATPPQEGREGDAVADGREVLLSPGLLHCRMCRQPMTRADLPDAGQAYQCQPGCRVRPLDAAAITDTVGRSMLRYATRILPATGAPIPPHLAATHAHRVLTRVTVGATASDITLTWRATPTLPPHHHDEERVRRVVTARDLTLEDPLRARQLLHEILSGVDPATAPAHPVHAEAATLLADLRLRLGHADAPAWAAYAHHSAAHLHGPTHPASLHALHLHAAAQRRAGHHQRAYHLYRQLAEHLARTDGSQAHRTLAIHATTALVLYDLGHCQAAHTLLADTITTHRREHPAHPATAHMTQHLTRIWDDCASSRHEHET